MLLNIQVSDKTLIQKEFLIQPIPRASFVFLHVDGEKALYKYLSRKEAKEQSCLCSLLASSSNDKKILKESVPRK